MAEGEGFEPPVPLRARMISNHVQSTTLPSLRKVAGLGSIGHQQRTWQMKAGAIFYPGDACRSGNRSARQPFEDSTWSGAFFNGRLGRQQGQHDFKAACRSVVGGDGALARFHTGLHNGESQADSAGLTIPGGIHAIERIK
jgi:hypothetical protein